MPISNLHQGVFAGASGAGKYVVDNSAMFNDGDSESFTKTFSGAPTNQKKFTVSGWYKRTTVDTYDILFGAVGASATTGRVQCYFHGGNGKLIIEMYHGSGWNSQITDMVFRDPHAWYNIMVVMDIENSTAADRMRIYVNGSRATMDSSGAGVFSPSMPATTMNHLMFNNSQPTIIGNSGDNNYYEGYMAEVVGLDGVALTDMSTMGETDDNGVWRPIDPRAGNTFSNNSFYLNFASAGSDLGDDASGNSNDFTNNNTVTQSADSPTKNYAVMTPLHINAGSYSKGGTTAVTDGTDGAQLIASMAFDSQDSDGYYFVVRPTTTSSTIGAFAVGVATVAHTYDTPTNDATNAGSWFFNCGNGNVTNTSAISNGTWDSQSNGGMSLNQYVQVAVKAGKIYFGVNNTWYDSSDGSFANAGEAFSNLTGMVIPMVQHAHASAGTFEVEFGAFGYTHAKPSGYKDITAANAFESNNPTIEDGSAYFQTTLYTGTGSALEVNQSENSTFQPDLLWLKNRSDSANFTNSLTDSVRGVKKHIYSQHNNAQLTSTASQDISTFDADGFSLTDTETNILHNASSKNYAAFQWSAGGASPTKTYTVKVVSDSGNKYRFDDFGTSAVTLDLQEGGTYTFNLNDSSNDTHPFNIGTSANANVYGSGILYYLDGVSVTNSAYISGFTAATTRKIVFTVPASAPTLYYFCSSHSGMGGQINTNDTFGSSNFAGSVQSKESSNTTAGFSIVSWTGTGANATIGHGLGAVPQWILIKNLADADSWVVYHGAPSGAETDGLALDTSAGSTDAATFFNDTVPTSTVFSLGSGGRSNGSSDAMIAYCWSEIAGFSKFGVYNGLGSGSTTDGPFIETGFSIAWLMIKRAGATENWHIFNNKSDPFNPAGRYILADMDASEGTNSENDHSGGEDVDFLANGFRLRANNDGTNKFHNSYIYMAFAENPFAGSTPMTAR